MLCVRVFKPTVNHYHYDFMHFFNSKLVDLVDLGSDVATRVGSSPSTRTTFYAVALGPKK
jgi:hypothetical protein